MGKSYDQLSLDERIKVAQLHSEGFSIREIASDLDRSPSTIARELKRNTGRQVGYKPAHAQERARARRWKGSRLERDPVLAQEVLDCLKKGWSPEQTCAILARLHARKVIGTESIYRFIYAQLARTNDYSWRRYLPRGKSRRGRRGCRRSSPASFIEGRVSVANRPVEAADRNTPGHWEAELLLRILRDEGDDGREVAAGGAAPTGQRVHEGRIRFDHRLAGCRRTLRQGG